MFQDTLKTSLELTINGETTTIPGGNVKAFRLDLFPYGFRAMAEFWVTAVSKADPLLTKFTAADRIEARLSVAGVLNQPTPAPEPLVVAGLVTDKGILERSFAALKGEAVLQRQYTIHFEDPASVLWRQHFPNLLDADATLEDVIKQQVVEGISLEMAWDALKAERPIICLGLGEGRASFYDFVIWLAHRGNAVFTFDYAAKTYHLAADKPSGDTVGGLRGTEVEQVRLRFPAVRRHGSRVQNSYAEAAKTVDVGQDQAVTGVFRDVLLRTPIASDVDERKTLETARLASHKQELAVELREYPRVPFWPGSMVKLQPEFFSSRLLPLGKTFRAFEVGLSARAGDEEPDHDLNVAHTRYELEMHVACESEDDAAARLPEHLDPRYPIYVEGKIVCEIGQEGDRPYTVYTDEKTAQHSYKVFVPLWNKKIMVPFTPQFVPGHFYIPAYKDSRVLLELHFDHGEIARFLDWGTDVQLPAESQGNHILLGKNKTSETSLRHVYVDSRPVFSLRRVHDGDIESMTIEEGSIVIETKEDPAQKSATEKFDLSAQVATAQAKLESESKSAISGVSGSLEKASSGLKGEIQGAVGKTKGALDGAEGAIGAKADEVTGKLEGAAAQLAQKTEKLKSSVGTAQGELKQKLGL
jgi:hypothetical protein